ncbi:hypothetical protein [Nitrosomonas sp. ANs5]|uniref:hypothetical protein n=1 Tax=Nitrosomonas sp. ANs5 TaxID=3423941 RepID=UPI003D33DC91
MKLRIILPLFYGAFRGLRFLKSGIECMGCQCGNNLLGCVYDKPDADEFVMRMAVMMCRHSRDLANECV